MIVDDVNNNAVARSVSQERWLIIAALSEIGAKKYWKHFVGLNLREGEGKVEKLGKFYGA